MRCRVRIPDTSISFLYDPRIYTALRRNRPFGGVVELSRRVDGDAMLAVSAVDITKTKACSDANLQMTPPGADASIEANTIRETRQVGDYTCELTVHSRALEVRETLTEDMAAVALSLNANRLETANTMACSVDLCGSRTDDMAIGQHAVIDILIGPTPDDLHLDTISIFPHPQGVAGAIVYQMRPLLAFTRAFAHNAFNWNTNATVKGGFLIIQLPRIQFSCTEITKGYIRLEGIFGNGQSFDKTVPLNKLKPEIELDWPVPSSWRAINGPDDLSIHRLAVGILDNRLLVSQRGAIDFNTVEGRPDGGSMEQTDPAAYKSFAAVIRAPCDGTVSVVEADRPDMPVGARDVEHPRGNQVCITRKDGLVVVLAHLRCNSIQVSVGDRIIAGQPIGEVGNSGCSSEPHLHMHVACSAETLTDGVIFRLREGT